MNTFNQDSTPVSFETATKLEMMGSAAQATCCGFCHSINIKRTNLEFLESKIFC